MADITAEIQESMIKSPPKQFPSKSPSMNIQDSTVEIHRIEEGDNENFQDAVGRVLESPSVGKGLKGSKGQGTPGPDCIQQTSSKSASLRSPTPTIGFVITHSTVELPCKSAHRPRDRKQTEGEESSDDEEYGDCHSDLDKYEHLVEKHEADEESADDVWFSDFDEDSQSTTSSPLTRSMVTSTRCEFDSGDDDWDFGGDQDTLDSDLYAQHFDCDGLEDGNGNYDGDDEEPDYMNFDDFEEIIYDVEE